MRRKLIAGNWKMNGSRAALAEMDTLADAAILYPDVDIAICPPATLIAPAADRAGGVMIGAQDCHAAAKGAHTGCISAAMLVEAGARLAIVGHSERRCDQHESDADVCDKAVAVMAAGMVAILCVGEMEADRDAGEAVAVVSRQLAGSVPDGAGAERLVIAYEPIWAIGTGRIPSIDDVAEMHGAIRAQLKAQLGEAGAGVRILYGGSMNAGNAAALLAVENVDGGLVGGASLTTLQFRPIIQAASAVG